MERARTWRRTGVLLSALLLTTGCYGPFNLTQRAWHWNGSATGSKWANEAIFFFLGGIIYPVTALADALVLNSVQFWTDENWVDAPGGDHRLSGRLDDTHDVTLTRLSDALVQVEIFENGVLQRSCSLDRGNGVNTVLRDADGRAIAAAEQQSDGSVVEVAVR